MEQDAWLPRSEPIVEQFEANRARLRAVAHRLLGSQVEAEDAVQEAWLRLQRANTADVENLAGWLTTVVSRVCLDMLRSRRSRREEPIDAELAERGAGRAGGLDPEGEAVLADSVGVALLVLLDTLTPAERMAFVLHDLFALPFEEIAGILDRSPAAAKQLASRARRRVHGATSSSEADKARQRRLVDAFLAAARTGDLAGLLAVLDPDAVLCIDGAARMAFGAKDAANTTREITGASNWAKQLVAFSLGMRFATYVQLVKLALIDGSLGVIVAPFGRLSRVMIFSFDAEHITRIDVIGEPELLQEMEIELVAKKAFTM